jgi:hypothetical protein
VTVMKGSGRIAVIAAIVALAGCSASSAPSSSAPPGSPPPSAAAGSSPGNCPTPGSAQDAADQTNLDWEFGWSETCSEVALANGPAKGVGSAGDAQWCDAEATLSAENHEWYKEGCLAYLDHQPYSSAPRLLSECLVNAAGVSVGGSDGVRKCLGCGLASRPISLERLRDGEAGSKAGGHSGQPGHRDERAQ